MNKIKQLTSLTKDFTPQKLLSFLRLIAPGLRPQKLPLSYLLKADSPFDTAEQIGVIELPETNTVIVATVHVKDELTNRSGKRKQYELAKRILKDRNHNAGIFAFYDDNGRFRLSLVTVTYHGTRRRFSTFRRHTFFVDPDLPNKTFIQQFLNADFSDLDGILKTFSLEAVSEEFYKEFKPKFDVIAQAVQGTDDLNLKQDFAILFVIRTIFLGFVQKKGWLGNNTRFLQDFWEEYKAWRHKTGENNQFYRAWLEPLFFEALSSPPGRKVSYSHAPFSEETRKVLQMAPFLNGELFSRKRGIDDKGLWIPDELIGDFLDFLFQYNFTVEENELYDEELELNPEFLGIIFERLTNMELGAVYTPRLEVDLMCRLALVKWLSRNTHIDHERLYRLLFEVIYEPEDGDQDRIGFSKEEIKELIERLENVTVCDPAAGSGAFEVGMLQVLDQVLSYLYEHPSAPHELSSNAPSPFDRKKALIARSLYGVEVKRWAVWINHLRLWLTLFVDMPDDLKFSYEPLLPSLTFKVRVGDSLVQRIGDKTFPVNGDVNLPAEIKRKITRLKQKKGDFFYNRLRNYALIEKEELDLFRSILDAEIEDRRKAIRQLLAPQPEQMDLLPTSPKQTELDLKKTTEQQRQQLEAEIADLVAQKRSLKEERPFIWSIEFAEILFDRGGFDIVIGNPPYVEQEDIADPYGKLSKEEYKNALQQMLLLDFPEYFAKSRVETDRFKKNIKPSRRSDLYTYFYIRSLRLLNERGVHVFICSNAWLDVGYGVWLQEFFLKKAPLCLVIDNRARRSFTRVDINTIITVAGAPLHRSAVPKDHIVRFVAFKKPYEEVVNAENFIEIEKDTQTLKTRDFRVFPISIGELLKEGSESTPHGAGKYHGDKWGGKYLRAPDVFLRVLKEADYVRVKDVAHIIGYVHDNNVSDKYPSVPFIKSIRDIRKITIELKDTTMQGVSLNGKARIKADLLFPRTFGNVHLVLWNKNHIAIGKEFYRILVRRIEARTLALLLNSTFAILQRELIGLQNLGGGAIKFSGNDVGIFILPNLSHYAFESKVFEEFLNREIHDIFTEIGINPESDVPISEQEPNPLPDRKALDDIVFDALGLTDEERKEVYRAVAQLVWERISKARSGR